MPPVIQVSSVRKTYGRTIAVDEASFSVNQGEIFGLIGPNGAGKTNHGVHRRPRAIASLRRAPSRRNLAPPYRPLDFFPLLLL